MPAPPAPVYEGPVDDSPTLSRRALAVLPSAAALAAVLATALLVGAPSLRRSRVLDAAIATADARADAASAWLEREESVAVRLEAERASSDRAALYDPASSASLRDALKLLAEQNALTLEGLRLGTRRAGETLDSVPATAVFSGDRARLPELLDALYRQDRVIRLVALEVELPSFGEPTVQATVRWEYAARRDEAPTPDDPTLRWSPPALVAHSGPSAIDPFNRGRWEELEEKSAALRGLGPRLRRLATMDAERAWLEDERLALLRWKEASASESQAVQRRLPELLRRMDLSATGEAALHPGPGGLVVADEG